MKKEKKEKPPYKAMIIKRGTYGSDLRKKKIFKSLRQIVLYLLLWLVFLAYIFANFLFQPYGNEITGIRGEIVVSGSMEPVIKTGSLVVFKKQKEYKVGNIINFTYKDISYTHRIIYSDSGVYKTRGDNVSNNIGDEENLTSSDINGRVIVHSYIAGMAIINLQKIPWYLYLIVVGSICITLLVLYKVSKRVPISQLSDLEKFQKNEHVMNKYNHYIKKSVKNAKKGKPLQKEEKVELLDISFKNNVTDD